MPKFCERLSGQPVSSVWFDSHVRVIHAMSDMLEGFMAYLEKNGLIEFDMRYFSGGYVNSCLISIQLHEHLGTA